MESGGGSESGEGRGGRTPPDDEQRGIGRPWGARGLDPSEDAAAPAAFAGSGGFASVGGAGSVPQIPATRPVAPDAGQADAKDLPPRFRPWSEPVASSSAFCQFLRSVGADGRLSEAQKTAVPTHRCAAFGDPLPLSLRQQELVCLQRVHVSCPRYVRGTLLAGGNRPGLAQEERQSGTVSLMTLVGVGLVILAIGVFLTAFLGLPPLGGGWPTTHSPVAAVSGSRAPASTAGPTATQTALGAPSALATAVTTAATAAKPTPTLTPAPASVSSWPPGATASRMSRVVLCAGQANCYVYTVGQGDRLSFIADFFGVDINAIWQMNPWLGGSANIRVGDKLQIPPPTK